MYDSLGRVDQIKYASSGFRVRKGAEIANGTTAQRRQACQIAEDADVILVTIGGSSAVISQRILTRTAPP